MREKRYPQEALQISSIGGQFYYFHYNSGNGRIQTTNFITLFLCVSATIPWFALCFIFRKLKDINTVSKFHTVFRFIVFVI